MDHLEQLQKAVTGSAYHQTRLAAVQSEEDAISALLEIAGAEGFALERADLERQIEVTKETVGELSDDELDAVSGGWDKALSYVFDFARFGKQKQEY